ncbi:MAG: cytochrome c3 family protein [Thermodesulfobacteriota bacterium]|nr:cytochrome c3 family protein [Thermodesulfobacteriota bacterium]
MKKVFFLFLAVLTATLIILEHQRFRPDQPVSEGCMACHAGASDPDKSHPVAAFGCFSCHLGNPYSLDKDRAHAGMALNPGDLSVAALGCGQEKCHPDIVPRVKNSIMATNKGILNTLYYHWVTDGEEAASPVDVQALLALDTRANLAEDHFVKLCASCHFWRERTPGEDEFSQRGGGCSGCHVTKRGQKTTKDLSKFIHSELSTRIPSANCIRCHNRSARAGLSYEGKYESEGYGTPFEHGRPNSRRLSGRRFYLNLPADVHHARSGMVCIDCHTHLEIMGDGKRYEYLEEQRDVTCIDCHEPRFVKVRDGDKFAESLPRLNRTVPPLEAAKVAYSQKGAPLYNLRQDRDGVALHLKLTGKAVSMNIPAEKKAYHTLPGHERLSCQSCHSPYIPQCYGCHITYHKAESQKDKLLGRETPGRWREGRSYMRFETPILGLADEETISPYSPCQVFVSVFEADSSCNPEESFAISAMSPFDPHTTQNASRTCLDCHGDSKALGLGQGHLSVTKDGLLFCPTYDALGSNFGQDFAPESFVSVDGEALHTASRHRRRPFNAKELKAILGVTPCLSCHDTYDDPIYRDFKKSLERLRTGAARACEVSFAFP